MYNIINKIFILVKIKRKMIARMFIKSSLSYSLFNANRIFDNNIKKKIEKIISKLNYIFNTVFQNNKMKQ